MTSYRWALFSRCSHTADADEMSRKQLGKRGIDPKYLPIIDAEIESGNTAKQIMRLLQEEFPKDLVEWMPDMKQLTNRSLYLLT